MPNLSVSNANENTSHNRNVGSAGSAGSVETNLDIAMEQSTTNDIAEAAIPQEANSDAVGQNNGTNTWVLSSYTYSNKMHFFFNVRN